MLRGIYTCPTRLTAVKRHQQFLQIKFSSNFSQAKSNSAESRYAPQDAERVVGFGEIEKFRSNYFSFILCMLCFPGVFWTPRKASNARSSEQGEGRHTFLVNHEFPTLP